MPLSEVVNVGRYDDPEWMTLHRGIEAYSIDKHVFLHTGNQVHRKGWEWTQAIYGLEKLGKIKPDAKGIGVGAGREAIIFYLADRVSQVLATDLYGMNDEWISNEGAEAPAEILENARKFCPRPFNESKVRFEVADGTDLPYEDNTFDFCFSLSSIEHFGGHAAARRSIQEMGRVLKPGGVAAVATEYILLPELSHPEYFNKTQVEEYLIDVGASLELVDGVGWDLPPTEYLIDQMVITTEAVHRRRRGVVVTDGFCQWTSIMLFYQKQL
jgi:SAM-dependent methyltransferase